MSVRQLEPRGQPRQVAIRHRLRASTHRMLHQPLSRFMSTLWGGERFLFIAYTMTSTLHAPRVMGVGGKVSIYSLYDDIDTTCSKGETYSMGV